MSYKGNAIREHNQIHSVREPHAYEITEYLNEAASLMDLQEEGRLIILPYTVGHEVWSSKPFKDNIPRRGNIVQFNVDEDGCTGFWVSFYKQPVAAEYLMEDIGSEIFLSKDEAEAASEQIK